MPFDPNAKMSPLDFLLALTWFSDKSSRTKQQILMSGRSLVSILVETTKLRDKLQLEMLAPALYADKPSAKSGAYRTKENYVCSTAAIVDYDLEDPLWLPMMIARCREFDIAVIFVSSPSHTAERPRFRGIFPILEHCDAEAYERLVARVYWLSRGTIGLESFDFWRSYFIRGLNGQIPTVNIVEGFTPLDCADQLAPYEEAALREWRARRRTESSFADATPEELEADAAVMLPEEMRLALLIVMLAGLSTLTEGNKHNGTLRCFSLIGRVWRKIMCSISEAQAVEMGMERLRDAPPPPMLDEDRARATMHAALRWGAQHPILITPILDRFLPFRDRKVDPPPRQKEFPHLFKTELKTFPMPNGTLRSEHEAAIQQQALRHGLPFRALAMMLLAAASTMADKRARFYPFVSLSIEKHKDGPVAALFDVYVGAYSQPPITWLTIVAQPGQRKTFLLELAFKPVRDVVEHWEKQYRAAHDAWKKDPSKATIPEPKPPRLILAGEGTIQGVGKDLTDAPGGLGLARDEGITLYVMGQNAGGKAQQDAAAVESGKWNRKFEGQPGGARYGQKENQRWECEGVSIATVIPLSTIQKVRGTADRKDGWFERMHMLLLEAVPEGDPTIMVEGWGKLVQAIQRLAVEPARHYRTTVEGAKLIHRIMVKNQRDFGPLEGISEGLRAAATKMHGYIVRYSLLLHMLDYPADVEIPIEIPTDTVRRAAKLVQNSLFAEQAQFFDEGLYIPDPIVVKVKRHIWFNEIDVITRYDIKRAARATDRWSVADLNNFMLQFTGWVEPQMPGLANTRWNVLPGLREYFAEEIAAERVKAAHEESIMAKVLSGQRGDE